MSMMKKFERDFVERTIEILKSNHGKQMYDVTFLLNCLLGMVTVPDEKLKGNGDIEVISFKENCANKLKELSKRLVFRGKKSTYALTGIRNAVAHANITTQADSNNEIEFLTFESKDNGGTGNWNMRTKISVDNLRTFAEYVAQEYINLMDNKH